VSALVDPTTGEVVADCTPDEARQLTERIRSAAAALWQLLAEAHQRGAWRALGYDTFKGYVEAEFQMSEQRAYQLLDQARVIAAITESADSTSVEPVVVTEGAARQLKPHLEVVKERVAEATVDTAPEDRPAAARAAVEEFRQELRENDGQPIEAPRPEAPITKPDLGGGISHPARYSDALLPIFAEVLGGYDWVLDPFAGTGRIHELPMRTVGVEIEPEWADLHFDTVLGSALDLPWEDGEFDAICTSPTYGNRLADSHNAADPERRRSYTHDLGRTLDADNSGAMQWGDEYRDFHQRAWAEAVRVLRVGGRFVLNIKDHIRDGVQQPVAAWHVATLTRLGLDGQRRAVPGRPTGHLRQGTNSDRPRRPGAGARVRSGRRLMNDFQSDASKFGRVYEDHVADWLESHGMTDGRPAPPPRVRRRVRPVREVMARRRVRRRVQGLTDDSHAAGHGPLGQPLEGVRLPVPAQRLAAAHWPDRALPADHLRHAAGR
jgi:SAM-dependent methyltransferase